MSKTDAETQSYPLDAISPGPAPSLSQHDAGSSNRLEEAAPSTPPDHAIEQERPTRRYQMILVLAGFMMIFQTIGIGQTYGIFQEFYTSSKSNIVDGPGQETLVSLVGTIGNGLTWSGSILVSPLISRTGHLKILTLSGAVVMSLGIILASFATKLWHLFLTQSLLFGIGSSLLYYPILSLTPPFFDRHRGFAMGIVLAGNGIGGLVLAPALHQMLESVGVQWTLRILGLWNAAVCIPVAFVVRRPPGFRNSTRLNLALAKRGTFLLQSLGAFLQAAGNIIPLYYLTTYSTSVLSYPSSTGSLLLAIYSAVNSVSRISMGFIADYAGRQNTMILSVILSAVTVFALWLDATRPRFAAFVVFYGVYAGGYNALFPTTITDVYGVQNYASVNAAIYFIRGLGSIFGAPVAGVILGNHQRSGGGHGVGAAEWVLRMKYDHVVVYDGALLLGASICVAYVRWLDAKNKGVWKWKA